MPVETTLYNLWSLALSSQPVDASTLAAALQEEIAAGPSPEIDFRTRLLIRDSIDALAKHWGDQRLEAWLTASAAGRILRNIWKSELGNVGFPSLVHRVMEITKPDSVMQFLRELGLHCPKSTNVEIGGSIALILAGVLSRHTEDLDLVDEIPATLRSQHELLHELARRYGLYLTHFQSHYLPSGWKDRLHSLGVFGGLNVSLVDPYDVFVSKIFSARPKDRDDLRAMAAQMDKPSIETRLRQFAGALLGEPELARYAADNWYILYGEQLPH